MVQNGKAFERARICTPGDVAELEKIRSFIETKSLEFGFSEEGAYKIILAVDEACSNLMRHAYHLDTSKQVCVEVTRDNDKFVVQIFDSANSFNPLTIPSPNMVDYFHKFMRGGLGIHIIKRVMDAIEYIPADSAHPFNTLRMVKTLE